MKQTLVFFISLFINCNSLFAQSAIISHTTDLVVAKNYVEANRFIDSILKKNAKSLDALIMKGNLVLNAELDSAKPMKFYTENDESVFSQAISEKPKLLPKKTVYETEKYWRKCLKLDSSRADIRKGLCTIYAMALMKDSLKNEMVRLKKSVPDDNEEAFKMCEYARKFKERNRFDEAMELYQFVIKMYPAIAGIRCDIASEYFYEGRMNEALVWLDSCYQFKTVDETSFLNGAFIYSELGYFDDAQNVLNTYSRIYKRKMDVFYYGLRLFSDSSTQCFDVLKNFCAEVDSNQYSNEIALAQILLSAHDSFTMNTYLLIVTNNAIPDYYKPLVHARAMKQFPDNCKPFVLYGILQAFVKNYSAAVQFLEEGENCDMQGEEKDSWRLIYTYTLYKQSNAEEFAKSVSQLSNSSNAFLRQAANYFSAKIFLAKRETTTAKKVLTKNAGETQVTKYSELSESLLKSVK